MSAIEEPCPLCGYEAESTGDAWAHAIAEHPDECGYSDYSPADTGDK